MTHYMIYYAVIGSTSSNSILVSRDDSSYVIRGLETYLDYSIQITASNKDEESDRSSEIIGKTIEEGETSSASYLRSCKENCLIQINRY